MTKTISATKKVLAVFFAVLMAFSCMAVSASAENEPSITVPKPTVRLDEEKKTISVTAPEVEGYTVGISISPSADSFSKDNSTFYFNLKDGTTYTIKALATNDSEIVAESEPVSVTLKSKMATPEAPVPQKVTSTSITVSKVSSCEYMLERASDKKVIKAWSEAVVFEKLTPNTAYVVSIRRKSSDPNKYYASDAASITVKTLKTAETVAVPKPVLVDKTHTTITVKCVDSDGNAIDNVTFSIDEGKTWQYSGTFTGLAPNTIYGIIARRNFDATVQDPNPSSEILELRTNSRERYAASTGKCKFVLDEETVYANKEIKVTVTSDGPAGAFKDIYVAEYGDTRLIPQYVVIGGQSFGLARSKESVYTGYMIPPSSLANKKDVEVNVEYKVEKYNGERFVPTGEIVSSKHSVDVAASWGASTIIGEFFTKVANLFLNTIPQLITDVFGSEIVTGIVDKIVDLIGQIGKPA